MKYLVAGLGNIGAEYEHTRHNIGFDVADAFVQKHRGSFRTDRLADVADLKLKGKIITCIKPSTYMNLSGKAIKYWMDKEKIPLENILIIVDELALPLSKIRIRKSGGSAGHNGLKSIEELLQTAQYNRLRFGIGNDYPKGKQAEFVLSKWTKDEMPLVEKKVTVCVEAIEQFILAGVDEAMNGYNKTEITL